MKTKLLLFIFTIILGNSYAQYCSAGPSSTFDSNVQSVVLTGANTSINFTGCPGVSGVQDVTTQVADLLTNNPYTANIQFGTCGGNYNGAGEAWIDFNGDNIFQASESIGTWSGTPPTTLSAFNFTVPAAATIGSTRMRVIQWEGGTTPLNPCGTYTWGSAMDFGITIVAGAPITCPAPTNLNVTNLQATSASLNWTTGGSLAWLVEYGPTGFTPGTGTLTATNPFNISGLSPQTTYDWYVADLCAVGDTSFFVGPNTFTTPCVAEIAPWLDDVETLPSTFNSTINNCWSSTPSGVANAFRWNITATGTTPSSNTGATVANSGSQYFFTEASNGGFGDIAELESPDVDISALTTPAIIFRYHMKGATINVLYIDAWDGSTWNPVDTITGEQHANQTDPWSLRIIPLAGYSGITKARFRAVRGSSFTGDICIDDIRIEESPTCFLPTNLAVVNTFSTSVDISWTTGGASAWLVEYGPSGYTQGSSAAIATLPAGTNPFTISGLSPNTTYDFYIADFCSASDTSDFAGALSITTACATESVPWLYDVETATPTTNGTIEDCWNSAPAGPSFSYRWNISANGTTPSSNTGANVANSGNQYFYTEASSGGFGAIAELESPDVDVTSLTTPAIIFYYHMKGATINVLYIDAWDGSTWNPVDTITGEQHANQTDPWSLRIIPLAGYTGVIKTRFRAVRGSSFTGDICIDDIRIEESPTCFLPTNLAVNNITTTSAELSWTTGGSLAWVIEYGPAGFTPGTGNSTIVTSGTNPHIISGLNSSTVYDWYVADLCAVGDTSWQAGPNTFGTLCDTVFAPYHQNFDVSLTDPHCWSSTGVANWLYRNSLAVGGFPTPGGGVANSVDHTSGTGNYAWINGGFSGIGTNELVSPLIDFSGLTQGIVGCWIKSNNTNDAALNQMHIEAQNGASWDSITTYFGNYDGWIRFYAVIPSSIPTTTNFRLVETIGNSGGFAFNNDMLVDDFFVEEAPTCLNPTNLTHTILNPTTVELAWTTGGASNWIIEYGPRGFIPGTGAGTLVSTSSNPYTLNLNSATDYDWYVQDSCSATDISWHSYVDEIRMPGEVYCDSANNFTYCYSDNEVETYTYQSENSTSLLHIHFNAGTIGNNVDFTIYDGPDNTFPILYVTTGTTAMTGIDITTSGPIVAFSYDVTSFLTTSCTDPLDFDINCCVPTTFTENIDICTGGSYTTADGTVVNSAGAYYSTIPNVKGCDSTITTIITVLEDTVNVMDVICSGSTYTLPDGTTTSVPGFFQQTIPNSLACDSTINLTLSMAFPTASSINASVCTGDAYEMPDGSFVSTAGNHSITYTNTAGCDSVYNVNLSLYPTTSSTQNVFICSGNLYTLPDGQVVSTSGTYTSVINNFNHCDSTVTTNLVVNNNGFSTDSIEICNNETYTLPNGVVVSEAGEYNISIGSSQGCDSTITTYVSLCKTTGIDGVDGNAILSIYPNPTNGIINIVFNSDIARKNVNVQLMNSLGQEIMQTVNADKDFLSLDVSNYAEGIYYIVVNDEYSSTIRKFIISK